MPARRLTPEEIADLLAGRGCTVSPEAQGVLRRALEAEDIVLELAEEYRPRNMAAGNLRMLWGYNRFDITEVLRRAIKWCEENQHAQFATLEEGAHGGL